MADSPMTPVFYRGSGPWAGVMLVATEVQVGTGGTSVGNSTTTSVLLPKPPATTCQLVGLNVNGLVAAVSASGTVLAQAFKRNNDASPDDVTLTGTFSLESDGITLADSTFTIPITATAIQNTTFQSDDACRIDIVTTNTVGTQPTATFCGLWAIVQP